MAVGLWALSFVLACLCIATGTQSLQLENLSLDPSLDLGYSSTLLARLENGMTSSTSNSTTFSTVTDNGVIHCNGDKYRRNLDYGSCTDAVYQIPSSATIRRFQNRQIGGRYDVAVPARFIGCAYAHSIADVYCCIEES